MNWFTSLWKFKEKADWRLCEQIDAGYVTRLRPAHPDWRQGDPNNNETEDTYTYYLYEDQFGNRKFDVIDSKDGDLDIKTIPKNSFVYRNGMYRSTIRPWLDGRYDPDISDYDSVPKKDFHNRLAKKKVK